MNALRQLNAALGQLKQFFFVFKGLTKLFDGRRRRATPSSALL